MKLTSLDEESRLWLVEDLLPADQVEYILSLDWPNMQWKQSEGQGHLKRRTFAIDHPEIEKISNFMYSTTSEINSQLGTNFTHSFGSWWLDEPGFDISVHTDGELPVAMQIYWILPGQSTDYGTCFYHYKNAKSIKYHFKSIPNSGYLMLNHPNSDGSRRLQWHGMNNPVPNNTWRLSCYWRFRT